VFLSLSVGLERKEKTQQQQQHHFPQIFIPQNTPYSASIFRNENSAKYTLQKFRIPQSTPSRLHCLCKECPVVTIL